MSAKRLFDVRPRPSKGAPKRSVKAKKDTRRPARGGKQEPLRVRRGRQVQRILLLVLLVILLLASGIVYLLWRPEVRITEVVVDGSSDSSLSRIALETLTGTRYYVLPRNSVFFFSEEAVQGAILEEHPEIAAVSIRRGSFTSLTLATTPRVSAFWWCGLPEAAAAEDETCYETDAEGLIFSSMTAESTLASSTPAIRLYMPLGEAERTKKYPLGMHMQDAEALPNAFRFAKMMKELGLDIVSLGIRGDEADLFVLGGTRITYVLGREDAAAELATTAFPTLNLTNGSIEYVDLRFSGKVYLKRVGE